MSNTDRDVCWMSVRSSLSSLHRDLWNFRWMLYIFFKTSSYEYFTALVHSRSLYGSLHSACAHECCWTMFTRSVLLADWACGWDVDSLNVGPQIRCDAAGRAWTTVEEDSVSLSPSLYLCLASAERFQALLSSADCWTAHTGGMISILTHDGTLVTWRIFVAGE